MNPEETVNSNSRHIACDGGEDGHPLIYLEIGDSNEITCPYCGRIFLYTPDEEN